LDEPTELLAWTFEWPPSLAPISRVTALLLPANFSNEEWMLRLAAEEKDARTLYIQPVAEGFSLTVFTSEGRQAQVTADVDAAAAVLIQERLAHPGEEVGFDFAGEKKRIALPPQPIELGPPYSVWTDAGLGEYIGEHNRDVLRRLERQLRSPLGVIPFVGAGMSKPYGFPEWRQFLIGIAQDTTLRHEIVSLIDAGDYEEAAEQLQGHLGDDEFQLKIADAFERTVDRGQLDAGALSYLPFLVHGPVITTNFDQVLEQVFLAAERPFEDVVVGPSPDKTVAAIHQNRRVLLKIHGDAEDRTFRVFTEREYRKEYDPASPREATLSSLAWLSFTNRPLLFLGSSLEHDRTVEILEAIHDRLRGLRHYAILASHFSSRRRTQREKRLREMGVSTLWFAPGEFGQIERLLRDLVERSSTELLSPPTRKMPPTPVSEEPKAGLRRFNEAAQSATTGAIDRNLGSTMDFIGRELGGGRLAFFLGAAAALGGGPLGNQFYDMLAVKFGAPQLTGDRTAIAAFIESRRGEQALWQEVRAIMAQPETVPGMVHHVLAALPGLLRARHRPAAAPLWVLTTNYDTFMEDALDTVGEPYYMLYYMGGLAAKHDGLFAVRSPDGAEYVIEQPDHFRMLNEAHSMVVKLNGGMLRDSQIEESVVISTGHFERLAARIPDALPAVLRRALRERSLLFLGHGLREPDVDKIIRFAAPDRGTIKSWAVQRPPPEVSALQQEFEERAVYLRGLGLEVIRTDLERFMRGFHQHLSQSRF